MERQSNNDDRMVWERQPDESAESYAKFCVYRDRPYLDSNNILESVIRRTRSMQETARERGCGLASIKRLSGAHNWVARAAAYDDYMDEQRRQEQEAAILAMRKLHSETAAAMVRKAARKIMSVNEDDMSVSDAIKMFEIGVKYERLSRGDTTDNQAITVGKEMETGMMSLVKSLQAAREKAGK